VTHCSIKKTLLGCIEATSLFTEQKRNVSTKRESIYNLISRKQVVMSSI